MNPSGPGDAHDFVEFCDWLLECARDPGARELLCVLLGEPKDGDLRVALRRRRRVVAVMTAEERLAPRGIKPGRRREIAATANVDPADVSELILRFDAAASLIRDDANVRSMVFRHSRESGSQQSRSSRPDPHPTTDPYRSARACLERDMSLWTFSTDRDFVPDTTTS